MPRAMVRQQSTGTEQHAWKKRFRRKTAVTTVRQWRRTQVENKTRLQRRRREAGARHCRLLQRRQQLGGVQRVQTLARQRLQRLQVLQQAGHDVGIPRVVHLGEGVVLQQRVVGLSAVADKHLRRRGPSELRSV